MRPLAVSAAALAIAAAALALPDTISAVSAPPSEPPPVLDSSVPTGEDADVMAAREGLAAWLQANKPATPRTSTDIAGCPAIELESFEAAMAAAGVAGDLGDWGTEIEWREYQDIDPDLMGIVCGGDTDGDAHDSDFELAAGVVAVDAGTEERAVDVLAGFGFGALDVVDADIAGVPGGTLTTGCVAEDGLGVCVTFWSLDGLIIGTTLWSDSRQLPDGASEVLLTEVLGEILATLASPDLVSPVDASGAVPSSEPAVFSDGTPVGDARAGLTRILVAADTPMDAPLETCVLADVGIVDAAMETSGADTPLSGWGQWVGPLTTESDWPQRGVVCEGAYVGTGDASFPETTVSLAVADFGDDETLGTYFAGYLGIAADEEPIAAPSAGGETIGRCAQRDRVYDCYEAWTDGSGFVVMVHIEDQTFFDRQSASVVVDNLVGPVLEALGAGATQVGDELAGTASDQVDGARTGLVEFAGAAPLERGLECPAATLDDVAAAVAAAGIDQQPAGWTASVDEIESANGAEPAVRLECADDESAGEAFVTLDVIAFADVVDAGEFVASVGLADGGTPDDLEPGTVVVGSCTTVSAQEFCTAWWRDGTLVVGVRLFADDDVITRDDAGEVLTTLVPTVIASLDAISG